MITSGVAGSADRLGERLAASNVSGVADRVRELMA
ncbi:hypothetical protein JJ691_71930 [Kutzneria sp. CA-103260]|nr:hypothetical protein JJ691_71930 [Kutzneria sp. CA-103260]